MKAHVGIKNNVDVNRLVRKIRDGEIVLWAGSGLSLYAGYPSANALCNAICDAAKDTQDRDYLSGKKVSLQELSNEFQQLYSRDELIQIIADQFDAQPQKNPWAHELCAKIPQIQTIVTTNYDHLFEIAYGPGVHIVEDGISKPNQVNLYKIHGDTSTRDKIVLTSRDYANFYTRLDTLLWNKMKVIMAEYSILFIGYSLEDKNIEVLFEKVLQQIKSSQTEFFFVIPELPKHKLRYFNTICKTTHIPSTGEDLIKFLEEEIRENIIYDAIDKKVSLDQAQAICSSHGIESKWSATSKGDSVQIALDKYGYNPFEHFSISGFKMTSNSNTFEKMRSFLEDCDCRELEIPRADYQEFREVAGIHFPTNKEMDGKEPDIIHLEKPEQCDIFDLITEDRSIQIHDIKIVSFWGEKRKRITVNLDSISISMLIEGGGNTITLSFKDNHSASDAQKELEVLRYWLEKGKVFFYEKNNKEKPIFELPEIDDLHKRAMFKDYLDSCGELYQMIRKLEDYVGYRLLLPAKIAHLEQDKIRDVLASYEPYEIGDKNFSLKVKYSQKTVDLMKKGAGGVIVAREDIDRKVDLFGHVITLKTQIVKIHSPIFDEYDEAQADKKKSLEIVSATNHVTLEYVRE